MMNIAFFLLPKDKVKFLQPESTVRQALEKMSYHRYTAVPLVSKKGRYKGTLTEGDLLWKLKQAIDDDQYDACLAMRLEDVPQRVHNISVSIDANMEDLLTLAADQNFVPVVDDQNYFIGIIRRMDIIKYCAKLLYK